jgi:methylmalonyl-CoA/ethylmalonyl-CoA epimerase
MGVRAPLTITELVTIVLSPAERWLGKTSRVTDMPPNQRPAVQLMRIDHVGVAVPDLDAALAFYADAFGMRCVHQETNEEQGVREAMLAVGTGDAGPRVQLLAPLRPDSAIATFLDRSGPGLQQLAYTVADIEATSAALRARGLRLLYDEPRRGTAGSRINFVHPKDAGGVLVELVQPA